MGYTVPEWSYKTAGSVMEDGRLKDFA